MSAGDVWSTVAEVAAYTPPAAVFLETEFGGLVRADLVTVISGDRGHRGADGSPLARSVTLEGHGPAFGLANRDGLTVRQVAEFVGLARGAQPLPILAASD